MGWNYLSIPNFNGIEIWKWLSTFIFHFKMNVIAFMLEFKLVHVSKRAPEGWCLTSGGQWHEEVDMPFLVRMADITGEGAEELHEVRSI